MRHFSHIFKRREKEQKAAEMRPFFVRRQIAVYLALLFGAFGLLAAGWHSRGFSDAYVENVFPLWTESYGRLTGLFPFSVGEFLLVFQVLFVVLATVFGIAALFPLVRRRFGRGLRKFYRAFAREMLFVVWIMILNCFLLYHTSPLPDRFFPESRATGDYTVEEVLLLYNRTARACNELSGQMERDGQGRILYSERSAFGEEAPAGALLGETHMQDTARQAVSALSSEIGQLSGYYPRPKALLSSDFMCQQYMLGYYFPFSMEANYNDVAYVMNLPVSMCHELSHLKGFIYEDEANFLGYLACIRSSDRVFAYSGYLSVLGYLWQDLVKAADARPEELKEAVEKLGFTELDPQVAEDDVFVLPEEWERINGKALVKTETVKAAADTFIDTNLKVNGVRDGKISYSRVVRLLLEYERRKG